MCLPWSLRRVDAGDASALTEIAHRAKRAWGYPEEWIALWRDGLTLSPPILQPLVVRAAQFDRWVVGFAALSFRLSEHPALPTEGNPPVEERVAELEHLWVVPECWRLGVGRRLFGEVADLAALEGCAYLHIESDPHAVAFYERMGARQVGEVPSTPDGRTLPVLRRLLP